MECAKGFLDLRQCADPRIAGLVGLLVGDALGVPYEFHDPSEIPARHLIEMVPPVDFPRAHVGVPPGTWSDDSSQCLCLLASLLDNGRLSLIDFAGRLVRWLEDGYMAVDGDVFDVGVSTAEALSRLHDGIAPSESGGRDEYDCGNGSLMRVLPLALWHTGPDDALVRDAHVQSLPTHANPRSQVACALYVLVARGYLRKFADPWSWADGRLDAIYGDWSNPHERKAFLAELDVVKSFPKTDEPRGTGYVVDCLWTAKRAMEEESFEDVAKTAIRFGNDTDTSCAVAAGLAGVRSGIEGIPARWLEQLRGFDLVEPLLNRW
ncbi:MULTISPECIES: ADP-ribosylglycohydrolase family protein [Paraburkholderia]|uniref:ADP-ribosylglycohydrolase family protein n=1 Tax=Paraburkholderia TaxID=1822464 RepID=UPI003218C77A